MKRELGIARCGLACCLCSENATCGGCNTGNCADRDWCENRRCSMEKNLPGCYACGENCERGLLAKIKPAGFRMYMQRYGIDDLLNRLEANEQKGVVYHRQGVTGDYDDFDDVEALIAFIRSGTRDAG
ncbi:MAG TPA: DUF3795 domain-containing protein [Candidatus Limiplasma sp.]|nr:DUF3795 domain-containing protein [Candidatus Limiplasma sp.]